MRKVIFITWLIASFGLSSCTDQQIDEGDEIPSEEDDLVAADAGKADTGYLSTVAMELEGSFRSFMNLDCSEMTDEERQDFVDEIERSSWNARDLLTDQLAFSKNAMNEEALHINLASWGMTIEEAVVEGTNVRVQYSQDVETLVVFTELEEAGIDPQTLPGSTFEAVVPADPRNLFDRLGDSCADGFDEGSLRNDNYFYYWAPSKEGCQAETTTAVFQVTTALPESDVYPEYDLLIRDNLVTAVAIFGAASHEDEVNDYWGNNNLRQLRSALRSRGFREQSPPNDDAWYGERWQRVRDGITEQVDIVGPAVLHDPEGDSDAIFEWAIREHEVVIYGGHSFYGSLGALDRRENYPEDTYQIFMVHSCWSYEYYTRQVFENKATPDDEQGWALADVLNNTEVSWFHNGAAMSRILLTNLFAGAESMGRDSEGRSFSWRNIVEAINQKAKEEKDRRPYDDDYEMELYGVSGVRTNCFSPDGSLCTTEPDPEEIRVEATPGAEIPDNNTTGVESTLDLEAEGTIAELSVELDITHTYVGDLQVTLEHDGVVAMLHDSEGGSDDDIRQTLMVAELEGTQAGGSFTLRVVDGAGQDVGTLNRWAIVMKTGAAAERLVYSSEQRVDIPDADQTGASSVIAVTDEGTVLRLQAVVDIEHTYVGDLRLTLSHNDQEAVLHDHSGGSADNIQRSFSLDEFAGSPLAGDWVLHAVDSANRDVGAIVSWSIEVVLE